MRLSFFTQVFCLLALLLLSPLSPRSVRSQSQQTTEALRLCAPHTTVLVTGAAPPSTPLLLRFNGRNVGGGVSDRDGRYQLALQPGRERPGTYAVEVVTREDGVLLQRFPCEVPGAAPTPVQPAPAPNRSPSSPPLPTPTLAPSPTAQPTNPPITRPAGDFDRNGDGRVTCADFDTQAQAREALAAGYVALDEDRDGAPCEGLPVGTP